MRRVSGRLAAASLAAGLTVAGAASAQVATVEVGPNPIFASNVVDLEVFDAKRERVGEIVDILIDPNAPIRGYVIAVGERAGAGERHVVVPASALRIARTPSGGLTAELDVGLDQLKAAPTFAYKSGWNQ